MIPQSDFIDALELQAFRSWIFSQNESVQVEIAREIARMRILHASTQLNSLRYMHSESTLKSTLSSLSNPDVVVALQVLGLDPEQIVNGVEFHVRHLGTTRPDDFWRKCGVGRPRKKCEVAN